MLLSEIVANYNASRPAGVVLPPADVERMMRLAVMQYLGYATLRAHDPNEEDRENVPVEHTAIDASYSFGGAQDFSVNPSELAIINPLFRLYVERENAQHLEASRALGLEVYGRSVAEVQGDIVQLEAELPMAAFFEPIISV